MNRRWDLYTVTVATFVFLVYQGPTTVQEVRLCRSQMVGIWTDTQGVRTRAPLRLFCYCHKGRDLQSIQTACQMC